MFSEALYILDKNTERLMVDELRAEVEATKSENEALKSENQALESKTQALFEELSAYKKQFGSLQTSTEQHQKDAKIAPYQHYDE